MAQQYQNMHDYIEAQKAAKDKQGGSNDEFIALITKAVADGVAAGLAEHQRKQDEANALSEGAKFARAWSQELSK